MNIIRKIQTTDSEKTGQHIQLERHGTMWEGSSKIELPAWMTGQEEKVNEQMPAKRKLRAGIGQLLTAVFGSKV